MLTVKPPYFIKTKEHSQRSIREQTSISNEQYHQVRCVENFRKKLALSRIIMTTSYLAPGARRGSTTEIYKSARRKWIDWCSGKEINPFWSNINLVLEFLGDPLKSGHEHS